MKKELKNQKGFTMIEIIISLALFSVFAVAFSGVFTTAILGVVKSGNQADAAYMTQQTLNENIAAKTYTGTQTLTYNFAGGPSVSIPVDLVEAEVVVDGNVSKMHAFVKQP